VPQAVNDEDLFAEEMEGVKPLAREARVRLAKAKLSDDQQQGRRRAAEGQGSSSILWSTRASYLWIRGMYLNSSGPESRTGYIASCALAITKLTPGWIYIG